jgi:hypothetical protein
MKFKAMRNISPYLTLGKLYEYIFNSHKNVAVFTADTGHLERLSYPFNEKYAKECRGIPERITVL